MTKARGAADSIGKAGRGASFLLPAFSPYYVPYFPLFLRARARAPTHVHVHVHSAKYTYIHTRTRVLFPFCPPPLVPPRQPLVLSSFTLHAVLLSASLLVVPRRLSSPLRRRYCTYVCTRAYVCTCASSQSSYARFHVARLRRAPAARGRLCTWVNGKMSFETFLGRSRSPHCQSYTREISRSRENARRRASFRSAMPACSTVWPRWRAESSNEKKRNRIATSTKVVGTWRHLRLNYAHARNGRTTAVFKLNSDETAQILARDLPKAKKKQGRKESDGEGEEKRTSKKYSEKETGGKKEVSNSSTRIALYSHIHCVTLAFYSFSSI